MSENFFRESFFILHTQPIYLMRFINLHKKPNKTWRAIWYTYVLWPNPSDDRKTKTILLVWEQRLLLSETKLKHFIKVNLTWIGLANDEQFLCLVQFRAKFKSLATEWKAQKS